MTSPKLTQFFPFLKWWPMVNKDTVRADFIAGLTGAIIVLPQGVAFAMIAGMPPIYGLYTAMITPIIAALFGSSYHLISGPTTAISIVVFSAIAPLAEPGTEAFVSFALLLTVMAGVLQFAMGLAKLGTLVNFVSHTVVMGFTAGAAILIAASQLKHVFGLPIPKGTSFFQTLSLLVQQFGDTNWWVFLVSAATLGTAVILKKISRKIPFMLIAMIAGSVLSYLLGGEIKGIKLVGEMPAELPPFRIPDFTMENLQMLAPNAFAVALLGLIEAVAIGRSIAVHTGQRIDGNQEFIGQGLSNMVGGFFSCYAGSGSFTRSGVNHQAGARTPMAAIFAAVLLMGVVLFIAPLTAYLPMPAMGGIILLVAYNLIDFHHIREILKTSKRESTVLIITFLATLFLELEFAIYIGVIFSLIFYLRKTSRPRVVELRPEQSRGYMRLLNAKRHKELEACPQIRIIRVDGSLFFGAVDHVSDRLEHFTNDRPPYVLLILSGVNLIDLAGAELLIQTKNRLKAQGTEFFISNAKREVREYLSKGSYRTLLGEDHILDDEEDALRIIFDQLDRDICSKCSARVFKACQNLPKA